MKKNLAKTVKDFGLMLLNVSEHKKCFACLCCGDKFVHELFSPKDSPIVLVDVYVKECNNNIYITNIEKIKFPEFYINSSVIVDSIALISLDFNSYIQISLDHDRCMDCYSNLVIMEEQLSFCLPKFVLRPQE